MLKIKNSENSIHGGRELRRRCREVVKKVLFLKNLVIVYMTTFTLTGIHFIQI